MFLGPPRCSLLRRFLTMILYKLSLFELHVHSFISPTKDGMSLSPLRQTLQLSFNSHLIGTEVVLFFFNFFGVMQKFE